jgi:talin
VQVKGKNKIVPRLLGVSRSSIMRVDEKTKEVIKEWPLSTVRRWAASPNSFTLDFGDYADEYYSVSTTEGETISRLMAGYIDFILKKKKESEFRPPEDDAATVTLTEHVAGAQGNALQMAQPHYGRATEASVGRVGTVKGTRAGIAVAGRMNLKQGSMAVPQQMQRTQLALMAAGASPAEINNQLAAIQQSAQLFTAGSALVGNLQSANAIVNSCNSDLNAPTPLPPIGSDPASMAWRKNTLDINAQVGR